MWRAFCDYDPIQQFSKIKKLNLPKTTRFAVEHLIDFYPKQTTGVTSWQKTLLRNVIEHGPEAIRTVGFSMGKL